jgi:hypothetical protein
VRACARGRRAACDTAHVGDESPMKRELPRFPGAASVVSQCGSSTAWPAIARGSARRRPIGRLESPAPASQSRANREKEGRGVKSKSPRRPLSPRTTDLQNLPGCPGFFARSNPRNLSQPAWRRARLFAKSLPESRDTGASANRAYGLLQVIAAGIMYGSRTLI